MDDFDPDDSPEERSRPVRSPLEPWPGEPEELHAEFVAWAAWFGSSARLVGGQTNLSHALDEARALGIIRPGLKDADAITWGWMPRARTWRRMAAAAAVAEVEDEHAEIQARLLAIARESAEILEASLMSARAKGQVPSKQITALEKLAKTAALLSGRPTATVAVDLSNVPTDKIAEALAVLESED